MKVKILPTALEDLERGRRFYARQGKSLGNYFLDALFSDIDSLELYAGIHHADGTISIARAEPGTGSAGSFFICIGDQPQLDFGGRRNPDGQGFAAFGRVQKGMDVVRAIWLQPTVGMDGTVAAQMIALPIRIETVLREG